MEHSNLNNNNSDYSRLIQKLEALENADLTKYTADQKDNVFFSNLQPILESLEATRLETEEYLSFIEKLKKTASRYGLIVELELVEKAELDMPEQGYSEYNYQHFFAASTLSLAKELNLRALELNKESSADNIYANNLFTLITRLMEGKKDWETFNYYLDLEQLCEEFNASSLDPYETPYLIDMGIVDPEDSEDIIEDDFINIEDIDDWQKISRFHEKISTILLNSFNISPELMDSLQHTSPMTEDASQTLSIIENMYGKNFDDYKKQEVKKMIKDSVVNIQQHKSMYQAQQNLSQALRDKNAVLFLTSLEPLVAHYKKEFEKESFELEDVIQLFTIENEYFPELNLLEQLLDNYDADMFERFMTTYNIPKNIVVQETLDKDEPAHEKRFFPILEVALLNNLYTVADSLIERGYNLSPFDRKFVIDNKAEHYKYKTLWHAYHMSEQSLVYLIDKGFIDENTTVEEFNIFTVLAERELSFVILYLYKKIKEENTSFSLSRLIVDTDNNKDFFTDYLSTSDNLINPLVLDVFLEEKYDIKTNTHKKSMFNKLSEREPESLVNIVSYLKTIFADLPVAQTIVKESKEVTQMEWFDRNKLVKHMETLTEDKEESNLKYIKQMLAPNKNMKPVLEVKDEKFFNTLLEEFPNFEEVINFYKSQFRLRKLSGKQYIAPVLLLGEPGIGKTYFSKRLAQYLNTGYTFIDMASITAGWILTGNNGTWKSAKQGKILEAMMQSNTASPIILMDEIEKAKSGSYDASNALYQLLEQENAKSFTDEYIDFPFNASSIIYLACANTLGHLSEPLQSRFKIMNVPSPTASQMEKIIHNIYETGTKDTRIFSKELSEEVVQLLRKHNIRTIKLMLDEAISKSLLSLDMEKLEEVETITLTPESFKSPIRKTAIGF